MGVAVSSGGKKQDDSLDRMMKLASVGIGVAGLAQKAGGTPTPEAEPSALDDTVFGQKNYELGDAEKTAAPKPLELSESAFAKDSYEPNTALARRMNSLRLGVKY